MSQFIQIRSPQFPRLEEERDAEFLGKRLAEYLQAKLTERGYDVPFTLLEDWGWWVELKGARSHLGFASMAGGAEWRCRLCSYGCRHRTAAMELEAILVR